VETDGIFRGGTGRQSHKIFGGNMDGGAVRLLFLRHSENPLSMLTILFPHFVIACAAIGAVISMILLFSNWGEKKEQQHEQKHH
jgi:hypothetical protein